MCRESTEGLEEIEAGSGLSWERGEETLLSWEREAAGSSQEEEDEDEEDLKDLIGEMELDEAAAVAVRADVVGGREDGDTPAIMQYLITMSI